jgi:hypothetical protein
LIRHPEDTSFRNLLHQRFSLLERCYNYKGVYLADTAGKVLVSLRDEVERLDRAFMPALRQGCELLSDCIFDIGIPPKVIWLRFGNTSTDTLIKILTENKSIITEFIEDPECLQIGCLELNKNIFEA